MTVCSVVGRLLLVRAAFSISKGWGVSVLVVPLAPLFFRLNYKELAHEGKHWRMATMIFALLFFGVGGSGSMSEIPAMLSHREEAAVLAEAGPANGVSTEVSPVPAKASAAPAAEIPVAKSLFATVVTLVHPAATPAIKPPVMPAAAPVSAPVVAPIVVAAEEAAPEVSTATVSAPPVPPTPPPPTAAERQQANRRQFEMLAEWYARLKNERGYLLKSDTAGIDAYNVEAAKYQAALQQAKAEQVELAGLMVKK